MLNCIWAPPCPLMPNQACLGGSGVPLDSPLEGYSLWVFASITPGSARSCLFYFVSFSLARLKAQGPWVQQEGSRSTLRSTVTHLNLLEGTLLGVWLLGHAEQLAYCTYLPTKIRITTPAEQFLFRWCGGHGSHGAGALQLDQRN